MSEIMRDMLIKEYGEMSGRSLSADDKEMYEHILSGMIDTSQYSDKEEMYVLSNRNGVNVASEILYDDLLHSFAKEHKTNLYILPSSIH